jgi:diguanylate cyclase (GGDEF)-like protein
MRDMEKENLIGRIDQALDRADPGHIPLEDLSGVELSVAKKINAEIKRAAKFEEIARESLGEMERTEGFSEKIIGVISAMIRLNTLDGNAGDVEKLCRDIVGIIAGELDFDNCSIMLKEEDSEYLTLVAGCGKGDRYRRPGAWKTGARIRTGEGVAGKAFSTGQAVFVSDISEDPTFKVFDSCINIRSILSVPVNSGDERLGVINFSHPQQGNIYDADLERIMTLLAGFVGQIITISRLYAAMMKWNEALKEEIDKKTAELTKKNRKLRRLALIDPLTGIYNRRFFFKRLEEEFMRSKRYGEQFSLLFIDIDNLKPINDHYGHTSGDHVIKMLAASMKEIGRQGDVASRLGGDEFGYILLESDAEGAFNFAQRLQEKVSSHNAKGPGQVTVSIGIANTGSENRFMAYRELYDAADKALYEAKLIKNTICFYSKRKIYHKEQLPLIT